MNFSRKKLGAMEKIGNEPYITHEKPEKTLKKVCIIHEKYINFH